MQTFISYLNAKCQYRLQFLQIVRKYERLVREDLQKWQVHRQETRSRALI